MNLVSEKTMRKRCRMFRLGLARIASQNSNCNFVFGQFASLVCSGIPFAKCNGAKDKSK